MTYNDAFFDAIDSAALRSASVIVPLVLDLVEVESVLDVGCGRGAWLKIFQQHGVSRVLGIDGSYVDRNSLLIDHTSFTETDLAKPFDIEAQFDLAVCLEVAEHLPQSVGHTLVNALTKAAPVVLFSAALPGQGGTQHINEQWPWYWERLFSACGFSQLDVVRPQIWGHPNVDWWYQQNIFLFAHGEKLARSSELKSAIEQMHTNGLHLVHKDVLSSAVSLRGLLSRLPAATRDAVRRRLGK